MIKFFSSIILGNLIKFRLFLFPIINLIDLTAIFPGTINLIKLLIKNFLKILKKSF